MSVVEVSAQTPYQVHIDAGALSQLPELVGGAAQVVVVHPAPLAAQARHLATLLPGVAILDIEVPNGEAAKTSSVLVDIWDQLAEADVTRNDVVIGLGGGSTTDLAGFVAASYLRGIGYIGVPTTVLAMVDAAVGGKTGINVPAGKNLVGAFWEPRGVICDLDLLRGLPAVEVSSGLAEVIKAGFTSDLAILDIVDADPRAAQDVSSDQFAELVHRAIAYKARIVTGDLREATSTPDKIGREALNYGHTLGHAIEAHHHFTWRHGEAISVGMVWMAEVSRQLLGLDADAVATHRRLLSAVGLPISYDQPSFAELRPIMSRDKKARGSQLRLIGVPELGRVGLLEAPDEAVLASAFSTLRAG